MKECHYCEGLDKYSLLLETRHHNVLVADEQSSLGRCVIALKRHAESLSDITQDEQLDFFDIIKNLEGAITKAFGANMFNLVCMMNSSYQTNPPVPHVHWHLRPRYDHDVKFAGITFSDPDFGHHYSLTRKKHADEPLIKQIVAEIKKYLE